MAVDNAGVDQVSRPMQIALVAVVLLAGMWFTVLKPKPATDSGVPAAAAPAQPVAPGVKGLTSAVAKAKAASATSDAANAKIQAATGSAASASRAAPATTASKGVKKAVATPAKAAPKTGTKRATAKAVAAKPKAKAVTKPVAPAKAKTPVATKPVAAAKPATPATAVDPSDRLLAYLAKGKTLVILFEGNGADDKAARKAVHLTAQRDPKHVVSAYVPISQVGKYEAITSDVQVLSSPTILVIGTNGKTTVLTGYTDDETVRQAVADARRNAAAAKKTAAAAK